MEPEKDYVIYFVRDSIKWYYANCFFKPFMPGLINAYLYHGRESAEKALSEFENSTALLIEER